ncbi:MAG: hypothetical protein ABI543_10605 [Ignavibacteria bacterium]
MGLNDYEKWDHLFIRGEYAEREKLLSGLTLDEVNALPSEKLHSIYYELWHITKWQSFVVNNDPGEYDRWISSGKQFPQFPEKPADSYNEWEELKNEFLSGLKKAMKLTRSPEILAGIAADGYTMEDNLLSLALHNAYHLGKIVAVRQMIYAWPPKE